MTASSDLASSRSPRRLNALVSNVGEVLGNTDLRRVQLADLGTRTGYHALTVAKTVWAYQVGGVSLVAGWAAARSLLVTVATPVAGVMADRLPRRTFMIVNHALQFLLLVVAAGAVFLDLSVLVFLAIGPLVSALGGGFEPAQAGLVPRLARSPQELTAFNAVTRVGDGAAAVIGPMICVVLLQVASVPVALVFVVLTLAWSLLWLRLVAPHQQARHVARQ